MRIGPLPDETTPPARGPKWRQLDRDARDIWDRDRGGRVKSLESFGEGLDVSAFERH